MTFEDDLLARVDAIDWETVSDGSEGATFPEDLRAYLSATDEETRRAAFDAIRSGQVDRPIGALATRFLVELLAQPSDETPHVLRLLVAMITSRHELWLGAPFDGEDGRRHRSRYLKWREIAARGRLVCDLLEHDDEHVRAHAAFLLGWLDRRWLEELVPSLYDEPLVRASALLAFGLHGAGRFETHLADEDRRVAMAAGIAASFSLSDNLVNDVLDRLELATQEQLTWPELPWCHGDLTRFALVRWMAIADDPRCRERARALLVAHLDGPIGADIMTRLMGIAFADGAAPPWSEAQRATARLAFDHPNTQAAACGVLARLGVKFGGMMDSARQVDWLRKELGLPRPPPARGSLARVTHEGITDYAQHWMASFSETGQPPGRTLARTIARAVDANDVVALLYGAWEIDTHAFATFDAPAVVVTPQNWPSEVRDLLARLRGEGWLVESERWDATQVSVSMHREGQSFGFDVGNEWNSGNPITTEVYCRTGKRFSLARMLAQEALAGSDGYERALLEHAGGAPIANLAFVDSLRLTTIAIWTWGLTGQAPPPGMDRAAAAFQATWHYLQGQLVAYARMLDDARREALVLAIFAASRERVPELYGIAPTERVLAHLAPAAKAAMKLWRTRAEGIERWARFMGPHAEVLAAAGERA